MSARRPVVGYVVRVAATPTAPAAYLSFEWMGSENGWCPMWTIILADRARFSRKMARRLAAHFRPLDRTARVVRLVRGPFAAQAESIP